MSSRSAQQAFVGAAVLDAIRDVKGSAHAVAPEQDVFTVLGLNSMETFNVLVRLEKRFNVMIGDDPSEFDRIRTFGGLMDLLAEKLEAVAGSVVEEGLA